MNSGILFIVSAPSGAGKTSLLKALFEKQQGDIQQPVQKRVLSVSHTTRQPRPGEVNGEHYHFVSIEQFQQMVGEKAFLESAQVFDNYYGTAEASVRQQLETGKDVILEIDWQGARQVRQRFADAVSIFVVPPSVDALRERLSSRGQDSSEIIERRMADALSEMSHYGEYDYIVVNDLFEASVDDLEAVMRVQHLTLKRQQASMSSQLK
ncbi:MAG TPA: guanylate kinase [Gammaproteobacteria bacterium]|nr:guanylate kinase [Gammaproteobacteria bacterium]